MPATNLHRLITHQQGWLNTSRPLTADDLQGRIILLDFWTFCCINCMHVIPDLHYLEHTFGDKLTVIGVHSAKFKNERDSENIRQAILRYGIHHPVVNDFDFSTWKGFGVRAWPTFILINPQGIMEEVYSGEGNREAVEKDVAALIAQYGDRLNTAPLPIALEQDKQPETMLKFPGKLAAGRLSDTDTAQALFVSDSGHHRILALSPDNGHILTGIGSGAEGFKDGRFEEAQFRRPQGVLAAYPYLYIADTENHALRVADLKRKTVMTLAGIGKQGHERFVHRQPALKTPLASPWDLAFYPDERHIAIAMAGTHQLWSYDLEERTVSVIAGNGSESIDDGPYPLNSLSQPSGLAAHDGMLYVVDSETSSLRVLDKGKIRTLIGTGLFDFGYKEGRRGEALMQHPLGVFADAGGVYIADSYNHSIRRYDPATGVLSTFAGHGERGSANGMLKAASFNEPNDLLKIGNAFYVADTNNHAIRIITPEHGEISTLPITNDDTPEFSESLPGVEALPPQTVAASASVTINLRLRKGWKINDDAPSYLALFAMDGASPAAIAHFDTAWLKTQTAMLPALTPGVSYRLQGTLYYCEEKEGAQCLIKSIDIPITASKEGKTDLPITVQ